MKQTSLSNSVKSMRRQYHLTQVELAEKSGVGLRFIRELEQTRTVIHSYTMPVIWLHRMRRL